MLQANPISSDAEGAKRGPVLCRAESPCAQSRLETLPQELARIEQDLIAGYCGNREALQGVIRAIASVEQVTAVDVALGTARDFTSVATEGLYRPAGAITDLEIYAVCVANGRLIRCEDSAREPRATGLPYGSFIIMPMTAHGAVIGVLAVFSTGTGVFGDDHILPFGTAAAICSIIAPQVFESDSAQAAQSQAVNDDSSARQTSESLVCESLRVSEREVPPVSHVVSNPALVRPNDEIAGSADPRITTHHTSPMLEQSSDVGAAKRQAQNEAIRALVRRRPSLGRTKLPSRPTIIYRFFVCVRRRRLFLLPFLLLLSSLEFGGIHMLRRDTAAPRLAKTPTHIPQSLTITKSIGDPRPMRGIIVAADAQITKGRLIQEAVPQCSLGAVAQALSKEVSAILFVSSNGTVEDVRLTEGDSSLRNDVTSALSHWRFTPFEINGRSISVEVPVTLEFQIDSGTAPAPPTS